MPNEAFKISKAGRTTGHMYIKHTYNITTCIEKIVGLLWHVINLNDNQLLRSSEMSRSEIQRSHEMEFMSNKNHWIKCVNWIFYTCNRLCSILNSIKRPISINLIISLFFLDFFTIDSMEHGWFKIFLKFILSRSKLARIKVQFIGWMNTIHRVKHFRFVVIVQSTHREVIQRFRVLVYFEFNVLYNFRDSYIFW